MVYAISIFDEKKQPCCGELKKLPMEIGCDLVSFVGKIKKNALWTGLRDPVIPTSAADITGSWY